MCDEEFEKLLDPLKTTAWQAVDVICNFLGI